MSGDHHIEFGAGVQYVGHAGIGQAVFILEAHVERAQQHAILSLDGVDDFARLLRGSVTVQSARLAASQRVMLGVTMPMTATRTPPFSRMA